MSKLEKAKEIIADHIEFANCGIFHTRNIVGDLMCEIYNENGLKIDVCFGWRYFEVFGLSHDEFEQLRKFYHEKGGV